MADPREMGNQLADLFGVPKRATSMSLHCDWQGDGLVYITFESLAEPLTIEENGSLKKTIKQYKLVRQNQEQDHEQRSDE